MANVEQENDAMLSAAMDAFMDDFSLDAFQQNELIAMTTDTHGDGQSQASQLEQRSSLSSQNVMAETVNQRKRRRKKKSENNMTEREELLYLRSMVQTLTQRLTALDPLKSKLESVHTSHDELVCAVWEDLTRRQRVQRKHSESENVKLRGLLDEQLVLAKEFVQLVARRQRNLEPLVFLYGGSPWWGAFSPTAQPSYDLLQSLDELYDEVDTIVRDSRFQSPPVTNPQQELRLRCNERGVYVEITESCEVPFAFEEATDLFWTAVTMDGAHHDEIHEETTYRTANTLHVTSPPESSPWWGASSPVIHPSVFDEMMQSLPNMNNQVDGILRDPRFLSQPVAEPQQDLRLRCNERGIYFEITESCEVQFAFEDVVELFWRVVCMDQRETQGEMLEVNTYRTENALMRVFQGQPGAPNTGGRVYGKAAHQRFVEPRRVTIVGSVIAQPERVLGVTMSGLVIRHQIWHVFEPSPNKNATFFRTYHLATPDIYDN
ncbi:hypothetical protein Poli38472_004898 [Pythium oligandrum]|uniref:Uncharacterized protein n=1 Tax=Pythium oligandrum TaxID=41045 RepID=A0A8K1CAM9_PYTOL|nr:hypothetical protein Poli38472_004898 [Pythium oligandrum]|eukprot:TMW59829.1 hypothetical protein Poli38472_004898 [Pythium oligandrum]